MVQAEVADRLAAAPGSKVYGVPSVKANWYAEVKRAGLDRPQRLLARAERRLRARLAGPPRPSRSRPPPPGARSSRSSTRPSPSAARRCGPRSPGGPAPPPPPRRRWSRAGVSPQARGESLTVEEFARDRRDSTTGEGPSETRHRSACTVRVPAKVNVQLAVGGARPDGFHDLANVFLAVGLYDEVTVDPGRRADASPARARTPTRSRWTVRTWRRARPTLLAGAPRHRPRRAPPHRQGHPRRGRHGGRQRGRRGRAAGLRRAVGHGRLARRTPRHLRRVGQRRAVQPGRRGGARHRAGRAADRRSRSAATFHWVFAVADGGLSTPAVYREFDRLNEGIATSPSPVASQALLDALRHGRRRRARGRRSNDLQPAALSLRPGAGRHPRGGHGGGRARRAGLRLGPDDGVPGDGRGVGADGGARRCWPRARAATARVASSPAPGATVVPGTPKP